MRDDSHDSGELPRRVEGLPVPGYRAQTTEAAETVSAFNEIEEHVLRLLDELAEDATLAPDRRWLSIGRTAIEQGFMAVNRSISKPERVTLSDEDEPITEHGWVLERSDSSPASPLYWRPSSHREQWTPRNDMAMRFSRREDAETMAAALAIETRVAEHRWS